MTGAARKHIGFTGTKQGLSLHQKQGLKCLLAQFQPFCLHHGDCVGADAEAQEIAEKLFNCVRIYIHPPISNKYRAFVSRSIKKPTVMRDPKDYLERNRDIVYECTFVVACPRTLREELRSGTWSTIRYVRRAGKGLVIIPP